MPNYCDNSVILRNDDKSKIDALAEEMSKKNEDGHSMAEPFNFLRPNPSGEWQYDWSVENWGTKWEAGIIDWERQGDNELWISFESAWSPPTALYEYLVEQGWDVEAVYYEPGMGYAGQFTTDGGDDYYEYDLSDPESIEDIPEDIIDFGDLRNRAEEYFLDQLTDAWEGKDRTEWFPIETNPAYDGWYEVNIKSGDYSYEQFAKFSNGEWSFWNMSSVTGWRGLAENPNEAEVG